MTVPAEEKVPLGPWCLGLRDAIPSCTDVRHKVLSAPTVNSTKVEKPCLPQSLRFFEQLLGARWVLSPQKRPGSWMLISCSPVTHSSGILIPISCSTEAVQMEASAPIEMSPVPLGFTGPEDTAFLFRQSSVGWSTYHCWKPYSGSFYHSYL